MEYIKIDMIINLKNGKTVKVAYDENDETTYILGGGVYHEISEFKNMLCDTLVFVSCLNIESFEYIDDIEMYYERINECIDEDYYKNSMEKLKDLFEQYAENECIEL